MDLHLNTLKVLEMNDNALSPGENCPNSQNTLSKIVAQLRQWIISVCRFGLLATCIHFLIHPSSQALAESPSPTLHWGGLAYPDYYSKLDLGYAGNRFTEFDGDGRRYNNIRETMGLNFGSVSWTEHWKQLQGWSTNLTLGAGPTGEQPTRYLQNEFIHNAIFGIPRVPVRRTRDEADFMIDGSITRWLGTEQSPRIFFIGAGVSGGSLYFEEFARAGFRHLPIVCTLLQCNDLTSWNQLWKGFHLSAMARASGIQNGAAFHDLAPQSYMAQASMSWGIYGEDGIPFFEVEGGYTIDSGVFRDFKGNSLEERFWSLGFKVRHFSFETWNDQANRKDYGPTYGVRIGFDVYPLLFRR